MIGRPALATGRFAQLVRVLFLWCCWYDCLPTCGGPGRRILADPECEPLKDMPKKHFKNIKFNNNVTLNASTLMYTSGQYVESLDCSYRR